MADRFLYRRGESSPVVFKTATAQAIELGDIVALNGSDQVYPASDETWDTNLATTQTNFADTFAGVCMQRKKANEAQPGHGGGDDNEIRVATEGVFEFDCAAANTFEPGDLVGPADSGSSSLMDQKVVSVASVALAIGRVEERKTNTSLTTVKVRIVSKAMLGGPQA